MSDAFSLIIPTFNRPEFLQRLLSYYCDLRPAYEIVVADSSSGASLEANRKTVASAQQVLALTHNIHPPETPPYAKLIGTIESLPSAIVAICADDDFLVPEAISRCVEFLEQHPDYSIAHGNSVFVRVTAEGEIHETLTYPQRSIELDDAAERLEDHLRNYTATYYSVHRRDQLIANMHDADKNTVDYRFGELLPSCLSVIQGKAKSLDVLYMIRQADFSPPKYGEKMKAWEDLITSEEFPERYAKFRDCVAGELMKTSTLSRDAASGVVDRAFLSYVEANVQRQNPSVRRARQVIRSLPFARRAASLGREVLAAIRNPAAPEFEGDPNDVMSLPSLLDSRSPFHSQFMHIYRYLNQQSPAVANGNRNS
jgi:glycosyltransferase domain-containing protein